MTTFFPSPFQQLSPERLRLTLCMSHGMIVTKHTMRKGSMDSTEDIGACVMLGPLGWLLLDYMLGGH
jgi:hypothetical protein